MRPLRSRYGRLRSARRPPPKEPNADLLCPISFDSARYNSQVESSLFQLPAEIRAEIFYFDLREFEDPARRYDQDTVWTRPGQRAVCRVDAALLRTCQRVYQEAWHVPFTTTEHTLYLANNERIPPRAARDLPAALKLLELRHGYTELRAVQVIAQLWCLERADHLQRILDWEYFHPRQLTITLRYTDWWFWEDDHPLRIDSQFANECRFPASLHELRLELETIVRKKDQLLAIADRMRREWAFERKDGVRMCASPDPKLEAYNWSGSSTLCGRRWIYDEARPETLDYHVVIVKFRPDKAGSSIETENCTRPELASPPLAIEQAIPDSTVNRGIPVHLLRQLNIPPGTSATDVLRVIPFDLGET